MKILLDTHILLWAVANSSSLSNKAREILEDDSNELYYSAASLTEISLKHLVHPDVISMTSEEAKRWFDEAGYREFPYDSRVVKTLDVMPLLHRDPFDRMLLAQASANGLNLMSPDKQFPAYGEFVISV